MNHFECPDCGAKSPELPKSVSVARIIRAHDCNAVCVCCGWRKAARRGLCPRCYNVPAIRALRPGRWSASDLMVEWDWLRRSGHTIATAAARLDMKAATLERAIDRAAAKGDPRAKRKPQ